MSQAAFADETDRKSPAGEHAAPVGNEQHHGHGGSDAPPRQASWLRIFVLVGLALAVFAGLGAVGFRARSRQQVDRTEAATAARSDRPKVLTARAEPAPAHIEQVLPGSAVPLFETAVYARTSGYLKRWLVDIGDIVKEGQLLAEVETPEVDAQLLQARATLAESRATLVRNKASEYLARLNLDRIKLLNGKAAVSQQEFDASDGAQKVAAASIEVAEATIHASEANVKRLEDLQQFQKVTAPFAGVITVRNYDPGALIVADNSNARELFHLAQMTTLRVFADVPQTYATSVRAGQNAPVFRREAPGREFPGTVTRTTNALDPLTRTLRVEVTVPNADRSLLPGMFLQVRFQLDAPAHIVRVPGAAVTTRSEGNKVAIVDPQGVVHYKAVQVGRDFGTMVEVVNGLVGGETLVIRPGDDIPDGTVVEAVSASSK
ncbi:efflux RND transporter periplasmic adaptor subunit [Fimbriiglobus ruber]|uniref:Putative Co/Zn/Cd efflux system membrane fusion protein n=1 Tax=Fimbriiglobus ruber TaxID=1908690 RepID=A0A225DBN3_9BACT|nr:efflux RND transporter periplasmic adaptor subunit [Fimbriiglobus ruber]OWK34559.1 putative Co/Zn/Cd efflux system membrane fusion protein [Fimbriiglobus ruber]